MYYELSRDIIDADRAWHDLEQRIASEAEAGGQPVGHVVDIIDMDVQKPHDPSRFSFADRQEARSVFEGFLDDRRSRPDQSGQYIHRRLTAHLLHLDLLENGADTVDIYEHARTAMNVELEPVDEAELDSQQQELEDELRLHGLGFDQRHEADFRERWIVRDTDEQLYERLVNIARDTGVLAIGADPEESLVIPKIVSEDVFWSGYCSTDEHGMPYRLINNHPRHEHTIARLAAIMVHEGKGHAEDFVSKRMAIARGQMDPLFGVTTFHTPENVTLETIAQGREQQFLRRAQGPNSWLYHFVARYHEYIEGVWNNAHIRINSGEDLDSVADYVKSRSLPYEARKSIEGELVDRRDDPMWRGYMTTYKPSLDVVRLVLERPPKEQERFFAEIGRYPYTQAQMLHILEDE